MAWQSEAGIELIKIRDPYSTPIYDEDGSRIRIYDSSELHSQAKEFLKRARRDPLYGVSPKDAIKKHAKAVVDERKAKVKNKSTRWKY
jgi:hypothetical protein